MVERIINQFRRIYSDNGSGDVDFTEQEAKLKEARQRLSVATDELVQASERLNASALVVGITKSDLH